VTPLGTADIVDKAPKLLAQGDENLVLVLDGLCSRDMLAMDRSAISGERRGRLTIKKGDQLIAGALRTQSEGNGRKAVDGIESEQDVVVLQFVDQHGDGVKLIVGVCRVSHGGRLWREKGRGCLSQENRGVGVLFGAKSRLIFWAGAGQSGWDRVWCSVGCDAMGKWVWVLADRASLTNALAARVGCPLSWLR
jgi:hypothetical protein